MIKEARTSSAIVTHPTTNNNKHQSRPIHPSTAKNIVSAVQYHHGRYSTNNPRSIRNTTSRTHFQNEKRRRGCIYNVFHGKWLPEMPQARNHLRMWSVWMSLLLHWLCPKTRFRRQVQDLPCLLRRTSTGTTTDRRVTFMCWALQLLPWYLGTWMFFEFMRHGRCHCIYGKKWWNKYSRLTKSLSPSCCISRYLPSVCTQGDAVFTWRNFINRRTIDYIIITSCYDCVNRISSIRFSFQWERRRIV